MKRLLSILIFICLLLSSCGYHFEGGGYVGDDIRTMVVNVLENKSAESGAEVTFTNALIREILRVTDTRVVRENESDHLLSGALETIRFQTLSRITTESVIERRVTATISLQIRDGNGDVVWSVKDFTVDEDYTVSADNVTDENNKSKALEEIAEKAAERLVSQMLSNF
jgi:outer membrane lipopolysaccharide assembly protein LptE/RlpB